MKKILILMLMIALIVSMVTVGIGCKDTGATETTGEESSAPVVEEAVVEEAPTEETIEETGPRELRISPQAWMLGKYPFDNIIAKFEEDHPEVTVVLSQVDTADTTTNMLQWAQGKTSTDLALGGSREHIVQYVAKDYIIDFNEQNFFNNGLSKDDFLPVFLELGNIEGTQYMIPMLGEVMFIEVNKNLMKEAGLVDEDGNIKAPATWDELYEYAEAATVIEGGKVVQNGLSIDWGSYFMAYTYTACLQSLKGNIYEEDGKTLDFVSDEVKSMLTMWKKLVDDKYSPVDTFADNDAGRSNFKAGKVAMLISAASRWIEAGELLGGANVTVLPIPGSAENGSIAFIHGVVIPKASPAQDLAIQFIKEAILSRDFQSYGLNKFGKMTPLISHYSSALSGDWGVVVDVVKKSATVPLYKDFAKLEKSMVVEIQNYLIGQQSVEDTMTNLKSTIDSIDTTTGLK